MTLPVLLAAVAGILTAISLVELIAGRRSPEATHQHGMASHHPVARGRRRRGAGVLAGSTPRVGSAGLRMLTGLGRRASLNAPLDLRGRLDAAGLDASVSDVMALKAGTAAAGLLLAVVIGPGVPGRLWLLLPAAPLAGFLAPDLWVRRRARRRSREMGEQLGDVLELLRVAVDAGLPVRRALGEVGRRHRGVLADELRRAVALIELGVAQADAIECLARRCPAPGMPTLVAALRRAERHGAPLGDALAAQAAEARARRARAATEAAARAAPKIQLIVALLLVPSAMLLVAAAMVPALSWR